jgi:hypothetical protein
MLSESLWRSIGKSDTEIGKSATKEIVILLSGKFFYQKRGRFKMLWSGNFFGPTWVFATLVPEVYFSSPLRNENNKNKPLEPG